VVTTEEEFAPDYPREELFINKRPWQVVNFGRDTELRRSLFPPEAFEHPAKALLPMVREMARYLTEPGELVLDPFAGTGSQLISALDNRKVALIELEPYFLDIIHKTGAKWREEKREVTDVFIYQGDCRQVMQRLPQGSVDAAIFSPPYSTTMASTGIKETGAESDTGTGRYKTQEYTRSALNLSRLNPFFYTQAMDGVMKALFQVIKPGGRVCVISKDRREGDNRIMLSEAAINRAQRNGFKLDEWIKHLPPSTIAKASATIALRKYNKEVDVVLDEDLLVFRKPE